MTIDKCIKIFAGIVLTAAASLTTLIVTLIIAHTFIISHGAKTAFEACLKHDGVYEQNIYDIKCEDGSRFNREEHPWDLSKTSYFRYIGREIKEDDDAWDWGFRSYRNWNHNHD